MSSIFLKYFLDQQNSEMFEIQAGSNSSSRSIELSLNPIPESTSSDYKTSKDDEVNEDENPKVSNTPK